MKLNLYEVKARFSKYIDLVESGETVIVCKRNVPVAEIRPIPRKEKGRPKLGWAEGSAAAPANFNEMSEKELAEWEGDDHDPLLKYAPRKSKSRK